MNCPNCQAPNPEGAVYCNRCGVTIPATPPAPAPVPAPTPPPAQVPGTASGWGAATTGHVTPQDAGMPGGAVQLPAPGQGPAWWNGFGPIPQDGSVLGNGYAGWWQRLGAYLLDGLIESGVVGAVALVLFLITLGIDYDQWQVVFNSTNATADDVPASGWVMLVIWLAIAIPFSIWYEVWLNKGEHQASWGKRAVGIFVTDLQGRRMTTGRAFGRWASKIIYGLSYLGYLLLFASAITIAASERKQALHDMMASTVVVRKRPKLMMPVMVPGGVYPTMGMPQPGAPQAPLPPPPTA